MRGAFSRGVSVLAGPEAWLESMSSFFCAGAGREACWEEEDADVTVFWRFVDPFAADEDGCLAAPAAGCGWR